jgi:hypothetical protein
MWVSNLDVCFACFAVILALRGVLPAIVWYYLGILAPLSRRPFYRIDVVPYMPAGRAEVQMWMATNIQAMESLPSPRL